MSSIRADKLSWSLLPAKTAPSRRHLTFFQMLKETVTEWSNDNCMQLAAALACYAVLSLAPLVVILFKLVSIILRGEKAQQMITTQMQNLMGAAANGDLIDSILKSSHQGAGVMATTISVLVLFFGASGVFGELQSSMNTIWGVKLKPNQGVWGWIRARFLSMTMVLGVGFLLIISLFVSTIITGLSSSILGNAKGVGIVFDVIVSLGVITAMMAMIYKWLPDVKIPWKYVWLGAFVTALLFTLGKWGLTLYFKYGAPASAYGVFGSLAAVVIWVYYSAQILFFGAEFTQVYAQAHGHKLVPDTHAVAAKDDAAPGKPARAAASIKSAGPVWRNPAETKPRPV